jgi:hypothetical protein
MPTHATIRITTGLLAATAMFVAGGCGDKEPSSEKMFYSIAGDLTPELSGTVERPVDVDKNLALQQNLNWRMASDDMGRVFYTDHPSRLSPFPITSLSGMPR